jgi:hypothetical protein
MIHITTLLTSDDSIWVRSLKVGILSPLRRSFADQITFSGVHPSLDSEPCYFDDANKAQEIMATLAETDVLIIAMSPFMLAILDSLPAEIQATLLSMDKSINPSSKVTVIPLILRPCPWHDEGRLFALLQETPPGAREPDTRKALSQWKDKDQALNLVLRDVKAAIDLLFNPKPSPAKKEESVLPHRATVHLPPPPKPLSSARILSQPEKPVRPISTSAQKPPKMDALLVYHPRDRAQAERSRQHLLAERVQVQDWDAMSGGTRWREYLQARPRSACSCVWVVSVDLIAEFCRPDSPLDVFAQAMRKSEWQRSVVVVVRACGYEAIFSQKGIPQTHFYNLSSKGPDEEDWVTITEKVKGVLSR